MIQYESINHLNTSLGEREDYLKSINKKSAEASVFLQTCNRIELYYGNGDVPNDVARHLFRVVCGLESAIVGERAVQGQVKEAYLNACKSQKLPAGLHKLFTCALQIGKRVRTETQISHGAVSHSLAAIEIIEQHNINLKEAQITIIGVNKLTEDIVKFLKNKGAQHLLLANRTLQKAIDIARIYDIEACSLDDKQEFLKKTDVLICATSAPNVIVKHEDLPSDRKMLTFDLAFPRDIDPNVSQMDNITLYNLQDVEKKVRSNISVREDEVKKAEQLIEEEIDELQDIMARRKLHNKMVKVIARDSRLSQVQVEEIRNRFPDIDFQLVLCKSFGDTHKKISLLNGEAPDDIFTRELDDALLNGDADIAIHSAKDLPQHQPEGLEVLALYEATDKTDSLVSRDHISIANLAAGSTVGTSSPLRKAELQKLRPDLKIVGIRGCIEERVAQVRNGEIDAAIVATCALKRLGMEDEITEILPFETHPMQGRLAITARKGNDALKKMFAKGNIL
ncbi:MAG: glutamyl-tRNA reductase [Marinilabiliaceae bacterium]|nr:glutamyl-tRNA reductase [Marinilabiliaceae bacterium]